MTQSANPKARTSRRVDLRFDNFREVTDEIDRLLPGYSSCGNWNLGQTCNHLRDWMLYCVDGYPRQPVAVNWLARLAKATVGPSQLRKLIASGRMRSGLPTVPESVYPSDSMDTDAAERYRSAIDRFDAHQGEYHASPFFGPMDRDTARQLQLIHASHHLSLLLPSETAVGR